MGNAANLAIATLCQTDVFNAAKCYYENTRDCMHMWAEKGLGLQWITTTTKSDG